jgi:hypothetical protein
MITRCPLSEGTLYKRWGHWPEPLYMYPEVRYLTKFRFNLILSFATRGQNRKCQKYWAGYGSFISTSGKDTWPWPTFWLSCGGSLCDQVASVSRARFVTAGAIDLKLCTYVPLGKSNSHTKSSLILGLVTRGPKPKTQKVLGLLN